MNNVQNVLFLTCRIKDGSLEYMCSVAVKRSNIVHTVSLLFRLNLAPSGSKIVPSIRETSESASTSSVCVIHLPARAAGPDWRAVSRRTIQKASRAHVLLCGVKLEHASRNPPPLRWAGPEQPALWTDVLAEMSRHIYIRNKIGEGIQAPIFQVCRFCFLRKNETIAKKKQKKETYKKISQ